MEMLIKEDLLPETKLIKELYFTRKRGLRGKEKKNTQKSILQNNEYIIAFQQLNKLYNIDGFGYKALARKLDISYTEIRGFFKYLNIPVRKGYNIVTNQLKQFRRNKAKEESLSHSGWQSDQVKDEIKIKNTTFKGVQGYYWNKSFKKYVWLRSSWEYIYAKWLDTHNIVWDVEVQHYKLKNGVTYRPDFFIYNEKHKLIKIVEIKSEYYDRGYHYILQEELSAIEVIVIYNVRQFINSKSTYRRELLEWKKNRKKNIKE
jgi:hypothetical protein